MAAEIRPIVESEFDALYNCTMLTFGVPMSDGDRADTRAWIELDRTFAAFDGDDVVATSGVVSLPIVVPGGSVVPAAAVTLMTTAPTHRRQGLMKRGITALLDQAVERAEPLATLWASESSIYGNLGFGSAIDSTDLEIAPHQAGLRPDAPVGEGRIRLYDGDGAKFIVPEVYDRVTTGVPGTMIRRERDWTQIFKDVAAARNGKIPIRYAVYTDGGIGQGYVRYRMTEHWRDMNAEGVVEVIELHASDATAHAELWRFLVSIDLVSTIKVHAARSRTRLSPLLGDPRRLRSSQGDSIWVRLVDPVAAFAARRYGVEGELVIEIDDPMGYASGRFVIAGGPEKATAAKVDSVPDVILSAESIGSAYLGAPRIEELAWAGRIDGDPSAVALLDAMMRWPVEPYCTVHF